MKRFVSMTLVVFTLTLAVFVILMARSPAAAEGARRGLAVCAFSLVPSLLPFFTLSNLLSALGLSDLLSRHGGSLARRLFHISGAGAQAFFLGITGGYPLGAAAAVRLYRDGRITGEEAERLLPFCNNSGPAFILGAAGGILKSPRAGALLYITHILSAALVGILLRGRQPPREAGPSDREPPQPFSRAFPDAAGRAVGSTLAVCGYVVLFSALLGALPLPARMPPLARALVTGFIELGSGTAALAGLEPSPVTLACAAFMLGWGGLSVHCQTLSAVEGTDIKVARHTLGRALCGAIAAVSTYIAAVTFPL